MAAAKAKRFCSACSQQTFYNYSNPLLGVPLCITCYDIYMYEDYPINGKNEIFCRWCGEGKGDHLLICDSCPKSFCFRCVRNNFGEAELQRLINLSERWSCFICSLQPLLDLIKKKGWDKDSDKGSEEKKQRIAEPLRRGLISYDVSRGRERIEIPVINTVDETPPPLDFVYVSKPVAGEKAVISNNPHFTSCCDCTDNCRDPTKCQCILNSGGSSYDIYGRLQRDCPTGIYECNDLCRCHVSKCKNRVVGRGPNQRLEVFRCENQKGWGVRCRDDILPGTFIADYVGEYILEEDADLRGLAECDEYLYTIDVWSRSQGHTFLYSLGLKNSIPKKPLQHLTLAGMTSEEELGEYFDEDMKQWLVKKGVVKRAHALHKRPPAVNTQSATHNYAKAMVSSHAKPAAAENWAQRQIALRSPLWEGARASLMDCKMTETEEKETLYVIDAKRYGSIARFLNHSCGPNLDVMVVFCDSHDVRVPRVAFFANDFIPANTELCYDYGYRPGNVEGKHRICLCGSYNCRKTWY